MCSVRECPRDCLLGTLHQSTASKRAGFIVQLGVPYSDLNLLYSIVPHHKVDVFFFKMFIPEPEAHLRNLREIHGCIFDWEIIELLIYFQISQDKQIFIIQSIALIVVCATSIQEEVG